MLLAALIAVALIFDFLNGLHDAANSIATIVSTRVLSPSIAVAWAAFFNFIAFLFFGLHVAQTIGTGIISPDIVELAGDLWRADGGDHLEPAHLVGCDSLIELTCPDRRINRGRSGKGRNRCGRLVGHVEDGGRNCLVAAARFRSGATLMVDRGMVARAHDAIRGGPDISSASTRLSGPLFDRPRRE